MTRPNDAFGRVVTTPGVCSGAERFDGTRIPVATVLRVLADGWGEPRILAEYPSLGPADVETARRYRLPT